MTSEKLTPQQREKIRQIANDLADKRLTFRWATTKEGEDFWLKVDDALERIANSNQKKCPHCGKEIE